MLRTILTCLALTVSTTATAHTFWLQPESHVVTKGEDVVVEFKVGDAGEEASDWGLYWERIAMMRLYGSYRMEDKQTAVRPAEGEQTGSVVFQIDELGSYALIFESNPSFSDLEAERFNRYVENEGLTAIAAHREANGLTGERGTELYSRRAKALIQIVEDAVWITQDQITQPIGQTLEIVPLQNPFRMGAGDPFDLQVLWRGAPLEGATLTVASVDGDMPAETFTTSADGVVRVAAPKGEGILYSVVWGVPAPNDARADYITVFSTLTVGTE